MSEPEDPELTDEAFMRSASIGIAIGIPVLAVVSFLAFKMTNPDIDTGVLAWLGLWTGLWAGVFLGGTVAVWNHLRRIGH